MTRRRIVAVVVATAAVEVIVGTGAVVIVGVVVVGLVVPETVELKDSIVFVPCSSCSSFQKVTGKAMPHI